MRTAVSICSALVLACVLAACKPNSTELIATEVQKMERGYCSSDVTVARDALLNHCKTVEQWKEDGLEMNYEYTLGIANLRLFALEVSQGNYQDAEGYFRAFTNYSAKQYLRLGKEPQVYTKDAALEKAELLDSRIRVGWKSVLESKERSNYSPNP